VELYLPPAALCFLLRSGHTVLGGLGSSYPKADVIRRLGEALLHRPLVSNRQLRYMSYNDWYETTYFSVE
jgi:hypothetical protein